MAKTATVVTPATGFLAALEAWAESVNDKIVAVADAFLPATENDLEIGAEDLAGIAGEAVLSQAGAVVAGTEKASTAVQSVISTVEASGKTVAVATAQAAVEQAYQTIQKVAVTAKAPAAETQEAGSAAAAASEQPAG